MRNGKVDDPRDPMETMTLDDQIDYAEWQVSVAQSHLDDLKRKKSGVRRAHRSPVSSPC